MLQKDHSMFFKKLNIIDTLKINRYPTYLKTLGGLK